MEVPRNGEDGLNLNSIFTVGVVSSLLVAGAVLFLQAYYATSVTEERRRQISKFHAALAQDAKQNESDLVGYRRSPSGSFTIPIERAMGLVVDEVSTTARGEPAKHRSSVPTVGTHNVPTREVAKERPSAPEASIMTRNGKASS